MTDDVSNLRTTGVLPRSAPDQRKFWDRWHREHDHASHRRHAEEMRGAFLSELRHAGSKRILEIGCGQGRDAIAFARAGLDVVALDHSSVALDRADEAYERERAATPDLDVARISWHRHDYGERGVLVDTDPFDAVYSHLSLHYFNDKATRRLFEDIERALRSGGLLFFTVRSRDDALFHEGDTLEGEEDYRCHQGHVRRFFSEAYARELLSDWCGVKLNTYVVRDEKINPGTFIRCMATRSAK